MRLTSLQIRVSGRVQGVGYREGLRHQAQRTGVRGWVRNRRDGTVEALLQGEAEAVNRVVEWARRGPSAAQVTAVRVAPTEPAFDRIYDAFERWPST
jgi:acylphosphatase